MNIMGISFYKATGEEIAKSNMMNNKPNFSWFRLPKIVLYEKDKEIILNDSDYYFQFFTNPEFLNEEQKAMEYILIDITTADVILREEISNTGEKDFLNWICFNLEWNNIKEKIIFNSFDKWRCLPKEMFFEVGTNSSIDPLSGECDYDMHIKRLLNQ